MSHMYKSNKIYTTCQTYPGQFATFLGFFENFELGRRSSKKSFSTSRLYHLSKKLENFDGNIAVHFKRSKGRSPWLWGTGIRMAKEGQSPSHWIYIYKDLVRCDRKSMVLFHFVSFIFLHYT